MLSGITITCFAASYGISLIAEASRLLFRAPVRMAVIILFTAAGLLAHSLFLLARTQVAGANIAPLSNWFDWCLIGAWILAAVYFLLAVRRLENAMGVFLLPAVLALIGLAVLLRGQPPFPRDAALGYWRVVHAGSLLLGTVSVLLGLIAGLMYLAQSYRLKNKLPPRPGFRLPSLEWLQRSNKLALVVSTGFLGIGLLAGIVMNSGAAAGAVRWTDPVVLSSGVLFAWLITATLFEAFYKPARQGRKVAYLTLASFIFLALALVFVLSSRHAAAKPETARRPVQVTSLLAANRSSIETDMLLVVTTRISAVRGRG